MLQCNNHVCYVHSHIDNQHVDTHDARKGYWSMYIINVYYPSLAFYVKSIQYSVLTKNGQDVIVKHPVQSMSIHRSIMGMADNRDQRKCHRYVYIINVYYPNLSFISIVKSILCPD